MRIIGGTAGGMVLKVPKGLGVRPTPDLVRQAIFNSLGDIVADARVLELFGGSGALSLECLSRGSRSAVCIEKSPKHANFIRNNHRQCRLDPINFNVRVQDAFAGIKQLAESKSQFDLIMADPPYGDKNVGTRSVSFAQKVMDDPHLPALLTPTGLLVLGHAKRDQVERPAHWHELKLLKHGDSLFRILQFLPAEQPVLPAA